MATRRTKPQTDEQGKCRSHPSETCHRYHGCRCPACRAIVARAQQVRRKRKSKLTERERELRDRERDQLALERAIAGKGPEPKGKVLPPEELTRLRRAVGLI